MTNIWAVFITGLTTGGLSCLAVQGGLLASSIASQAEDDIKEGLSGAQASRGEEFDAALCQLQGKGLSAKAYRRKSARLREQYPVLSEEPPKTPHHGAQAIILFLAAKLVAYTLLGLLLGWLGSVLQLTPLMRGWLQLGIGVFMVGQALRMFDVHPVFRYFAISPPRSVTRYIRRISKNGRGDLATPLFLGALTVLIPCGITQGMMALAVGTGSPALGAAIMFSFVLGTSPVFFVLSYLATKLGERMQGNFTRFAAVVVLVLGLVSLEGGLNLVGSSVSLAAFKDMVASWAPSADTAVPAGSQGIAARSPGSVGNTITITADGNGYSPHVSTAKAGQPITLQVESKDLYTCAQGMVFPKLGIQKQLPPNGTTTIQIPAQPAGTLAYTCSMGMYRGQITID